ncbi:hypothetical protein ABIF52_004012 [Bradyrhizobium japonicum]
MARKRAPACARCCACYHRATSRNCRGNTHDHSRSEPAHRTRRDRGHQPSRLLSRHERAGAADVLGLRGGLGARRHGLHDLSAGDRHHHRAVEGRCGLGGSRRHRDAAGLCDRRLARRLPLRPYRTGQDAPDHHHLVLVLLAGLCRRAEFRPAPDCTRRARPRLRRRMGGGRRADGRGDPAAISRARGRLGAVGLGGRLGSRRAVAGDPVLASAGRDGLALDVRDRRAAGALGVLHPPLRHRAGDRSRGPVPGMRKRAVIRSFGRSSPSRW